MKILLSELTAAKTIPFTVSQSEAISSFISNNKSEAVPTISSQQQKQFQHIWTWVGLKGMREWDEGGFVGEKSDGLKVLKEERDLVYLSIFL